MLKQIFGAAAMAAMLAVPSQAQDNPVLATVDGKDITAADVAFAVTTLGQALQQVPAPNRPQMVLDLLIDMAILANAAEAAGLDEDPALERRVDYYRTQTLRDLYMEKLIAEKITDEAVRARYQEEIADLEPREEVSARHILVPEEEKAKELIAALNDGADFETLARENSQDPGSAANGGSLGFFGRGQMVPPFEEAAFSLEPGAVTEAPVQSQFGFHIIKVDEKRTQPIPAFEEVADSVRRFMMQEAFSQELATLKAAASIEKTEPAQ